jgi:hypothetical protein
MGAPAPEFNIPDTAIATDKYGFSASYYGNPV